MKDDHLHIHLHGANTPRHLHLHFHGEQSRGYGPPTKYRDFDEIYTPIPYPTETQSKETANPNLGEICAQGRSSMSSKAPKAVWAKVFHDPAAVPSVPNPPIPTGAVAARIETTGHWYFDQSSTTLIPGVWHNPEFFRDQNWLVFYIVFENPDPTTSDDIIRVRSRRIMAVPSQTTECEMGGSGGSGSGSGELATIFTVIEFAVPQTLQLSTESPFDDAVAQETLQLTSPTMLQYDTLSSNVGVPQWQATVNGHRWRVRVSNVGDNKRGVLHCFTPHSNEPLEWATETWCFKKRNVLTGRNVAESGAPRHLILESV